MLIADCAESLKIICEVRNLLFKETKPSIIGCRNNRAGRGQSNIWLTLVRRNTRERSEHASLRRTKHSPSLHT